MRLKIPLPALLTFEALKPLMINDKTENNMKKILPFCFALIFSLSMLQVSGNGHNAAKNEMSYTLSGVVLDKFTGETLAGVAVAIEGSDIVSYTDFDGVFRIPGIYGGNHKLSFRYISYKQEVKTQTVQFDNPSLNMVVRMEKL
jgi:hypothetical protein